LPRTTCFFLPKTRARLCADNRMILMASSHARETGPRIDKYFVPPRQSRSLARTPLRPVLQAVASQAHGVVVAAVRVVHKSCLRFRLSACKLGDRALHDNAPIGKVTQIAGKCNGHSLTCDRAI
jgi:hypothetical protein